MGSLKRKFDLSTADSIMPRKYVRSSRRRYGRRYKPYGKFGLSFRSKLKERCPTHTFNWLGNASNLTTTGINNRHGQILLNTGTLLPNCQGFLKLRSVYAMYKIKKIVVKVIPSDDEALSYNFTATMQYNPVALYPTLNDSDNQIEGANNITKFMQAGKPAYFNCRWNTLRQTYSSLLTSGYEATNSNNAWYTTGGPQSGNITDVHFGRLVVSSPGTNLASSASAIRIVIEFTAEFSNPIFDA